MSKGTHLEKYTRALLENQVSGEFVEFLDDETLKDSIGVKSALHRAQILKHVKTLTRGNEISHRCRDESAQYRGQGRVQQCRNWSQGNCRFGESCRYAHSESSSTPRNSRTNERSGQVGYICRGNQSIGTVSGGVSQQEIDPTFGHTV